ncbi:MAG TPA: peroxiredoxin [Rhodanobacteraceae bacterium]
MKRWFAFAAPLLALVALPVLAATLSVGAKAPAFAAPASLAGHDFTFSLNKALAKGPVVVYFFPAAFTQGCDIEAHTFSTHKADFVKAGATIIGVSEDSMATLNKFSSDPKYCAGKFPVASDPSGSIGVKYGVPMAPPMRGATNVNHQPVTHGFFARTTFVIGRDGKIVASFSTRKDHITPAEHVTRSLAIVRRLQAAKAR